MAMISESGIIAKLEETLRSSAPEGQRLSSAFRLLAKYRSAQLQTLLIKAHGLTVLGGPFQGMAFVATSAEGCHIPKLLGCYEAELHPHILSAATRNYRAVINIGAAEGYYAVGLARLMPSATVHAYDTNAAAQSHCRELAQLNGVSERVVVGGTFGHKDFEAFADRKTLLVCDIEGAEEDLLDPERAPALRLMDIVVELHNRPGHALSRIVPARFAATHHCVLLDQSGRNFELPPALRRLGHLDQLIAVWEWRTTPTPWAVMTRKA
jgi:hypothetical protein